MFRMNFPRRFTSRPDFRLWPPPRNRPLNYRRQYARPVSCDPPSPPPCFFHAARFHLQDYYRSSQRQSANRETPDGVERLRGCAKSVSVWDLDNRAADATPGFSFFLFAVEDVVYSLPSIIWYNFAIWYYLFLGMVYQVILMGLINYLQKSSN